MPMSSGVLCEALQALADEEGMVTPEALREVGSFDEGVAAILEQQLGPSPWRLAPLEELLGELSALTPRAADAMRPDGTVPGEEPCGWRTIQLQQLEQAVDAALAEEDIAGALDGGDLADQEDMDRLAADIESADKGLDQVKRSLMRQVVTPLLEAVDSQPAREVMELPDVLEELVSLLRRTSRLSLIRGQRQQTLAAQLSRLRAEARTQAERAEREKKARVLAEADAGQGEKAQDLLESTIARLTVARKSIKEREFELMGQRQKVEKAEGEKIRLEARCRELELALQREARARGEAERTSSDRQSTIDDESAQQLGEMRRRLMSVELANDQLHEQLSAAELRHFEATSEETRRAAELQVAQHRNGELESSLSESRRTIEELEQRLAEREPRLCGTGDTGTRDPATDGSCGYVSAADPERQRGLGGGGTGSSADSGGADAEGRPKAKATPRVRASTGTEKATPREPRRSMPSRLPGTGSMSMSMTDLRHIFRGEAEEGSGGQGQPSRQQRSGVGNQPRQSTRRNNSSAQLLADAARPAVPTSLNTQTRPTLADAADMSGLQSLFKMLSGTVGIKGKGKGKGRSGL